MKNYLDEHQIQSSFITWAQTQVMTGKYPELALVFAIPNGMPVSKRTRGRFVAEGLMQGVSDLFLPVARGGFHGMFIELKKQNGRVSPEQKAFIAAVQQQGYYAKVVYGLDEIISTVLEYLNRNS